MIRSYFRLKFPSARLRQFDLALGAPAPFALALMAPKAKRARRTPAPVDPKAASPIHAACARHADGDRGVSQAAVHEVLTKLGFAKAAGRSNLALRDKRLAPVAEACGVPFARDPFGAGGHVSLARSSLSASST